MKPLTLSFVSLLIAGNAFAHTVKQDGGAEVHSGPSPADVFVGKVSKGCIVNVLNLQNNGWRRVDQPFDGWIRTAVLDATAHRMWIGSKEAEIHAEASGDSKRLKIVKEGSEVTTVYSTADGNWVKLSKPAHGWVLRSKLTYKKPDVFNLGQTFWGTAYRSGRAYRIELVRIDGKAVALKSAKPFLTMRAAAAKDGVHIYVVSGFRTMAEQQALWNRYGAPRAARPGYSNHQTGIAFDLNTSGFGGSVYNWLSHHAGHYGFKRTVSFEPWHWEYLR